MKRKLIELLKRYDVPAPRYTSYPTVPAWSAEVGVREYQEGLSQLKPHDLLSLYFHLPFCEQLCHFCGCMQVITKRHERSKEYLEVLLSEMDQVIAAIPPKSRNVSQIHFGGGTPNFFQPEELKVIMTHIHQHFQVQDDAEIAIELHPRTQTEAFCDILQELKFNRISLGVQDFEEKVQALINRFQTFEQTQAMVSYLRYLGMNAFNFDLIYGLPGQTLAGWQRTLDRVIDLKPNRLAVYSYAHVPWVRPVQRSFQDADIPPAAMKLQLFEMAYRTFTEKGYRHIGIDHFALEDDELCQALTTHTLHRNFMGYSTKADAHQIGFGVSAISYAGGHYFQNQKELPTYYKTIREGHLATFRGHLLDHDDALRRALITQVMCNGVVDIPAFEKKWEINFQDYFAPNLAQLEPMVIDQLVAVSTTELKAINEGGLLLRNVAMTFDRHLAGVQKGAQTPIFSRSV
jgi:oxygen-independent coproporphyrinogen III oxidase